MARGKSYTTKDVSDLLQVSPSYINAWVRSGWVSPSIRCADGKQGSYHLWSFSDLVSANVIRILLESKIPHKVIDSAANMLRNGVLTARNDELLAISPNSARVIAADLTALGAIRTCKSSLLLIISVDQVASNLQLAVAT